jgi:alpha-tubulin suppressor-like RCC1 family protein
MKKLLLLSIPALLLFFSYNNLSAQNSMTGDGFGGRGWYKPHNYSVGAYSGFTVCGDSNQLYAWGGNIWGELGNGTFVSSTTPVAVIGMNKVKFYATGYLSTAIKADSTAWVWGNTDMVNVPSGFSTIPAYVLGNVKFADASVIHVVFVKNDSTVWAAGRNDFGELGNGTTSSIPVSNPVQMQGVHNAVRAVAAGFFNNFIQGASIILLADGTVKVTGGSWFQTTSSNVPVIMPGLNNIVDIKSNAAAAFALNSSGQVYAFGKDILVNGTDTIPVLGLGSTNFYFVPPTKITFPAGAAPIVALSANSDGSFCLALDENHKVYAWGTNEHGQLGDGTFTNRSKPVLVATNVIDIFAGESFSYVLKADSTLWASGESGYPFIPIYQPSFYGSIWMNLPNIKRNVFTQINPTIAPMNLCAPKVFGVVPVKLSSFTCIANGNTAYLNWQSAEETNASKYIVQYSNNGSSFKDIATVFAIGSNSKYNYIHQQVSGTAFYRLQMMDKDGRFTYSEIRVVKFDNKAGFTIAPNPANDVVYLFTKSNAVIKSIQILSIDGQIIKNLNGYNNGQQISISNLAKGTYILKAVYKNNEMEYGRFIKM